jgi:3-hydroxymyristoyl/3-hydroxydecanoyl-(acyl carrier protein) dehydratase/NAD(P)-dependent dehydrogenase (short-subunit alcohol dehydrogenase family)
MLKGKNLLIIGAREGGYGAAIAKASVAAGAQVFGTSLNPEDPREQAFFNQLDTTLIDVPLRYSFDQRCRVFDDLALIQGRLRDIGVNRLDAVVHTVAGGFPRQPSVMKAVGDILKGKQTFFDMATAVKRNVYYVNADSFADTVSGLSDLTHKDTQFMALTYRGDLPYFISHTKKHLEDLAARLARQGRRTLVAALPEAWTQSSQFFTGIEIAVIHNYLRDLQQASEISPDLAPAFSKMEQSLAALRGWDRLLDDLKTFLGEEWSSITHDSDLGRLSKIVEKLFAALRRDRTFSVLREAVGTISNFVREASGIIVVREFISKGRYQPGDVRQVYYRDLTGSTSVGTASPRELQPRKPTVNRTWVCYEKEEIARTLDMYGKNFLFLDRVVMEQADIYDGFYGFARFTVPTPEQNPILKDHFVGMPLFGGHLQMEAVAQFAAFMVLKLLKNQKLMPILTGTEFPDLNTMAPPGETLTMMGIITIPEKRNLVLEAFIENRYARSKGTIRGMVLNERVVRKMMASFDSDNTED